MPDQPDQTVDHQAADKPPSLLREFGAFLRHNKKWWLLPIIAAALIVGILLLLASTAPAPFIYSLF